MHFTPARVLAGLCLGLWLPSAAVAQNVSFTTLSQSASGGSPQASQQLVRTEAEFQAAGLDQLVPNAQIDWNDENVIAVHMGARTTGGYSINIERIRLRPMPPPPVGAPVSPMHFIEVSVRSSSPAPGSIVTQAITMPYHVIKLAKDPMGIVQFRHLGGSQGVGMGHLSFDNLMQGRSGPNSAWNIVLGSFAQLDAYLPQGAPVGMHVDWANEVVVAVGLGATSWGTDVEIIDIERRHMVPATLPGGATPMPPYPIETVVTYQRTDPTGPVISLAAAPVHLVTVARIPQSDLVVFQQSQQNPFDALSRQRNYGPNIQTTDVRVDKDGNVRIVESGGLSGPGADITDSATAAELQALKVAVAAARFDTMPDNLSAPGQSPPFVSDTTTYMVDGGAQGNRKVGGWTGLFDPQYQNRIDPVDAALDAIVDRLKNSGAPLFNSATLSTQHPFGSSSQWPMSRDIVVESDGTVRVLKSHPTALFAPIDGTATQAELDRLTDAIRAGALGTIPSPLPVVIPMHLMHNPFTLAVRAPSSQSDATITGQYDYYGQFDGQLRPVIETLEAIGRRVELQTFPPSSVSGEVEVEADGTITLRDGNDTWTLTNAANEQLSRDLRKFRGRTVTVQGDVTLASVAPGAALHGAVDAQAITNPVRQSLTAVVYEDQAGDPVLMLGSVFQTAPLQRIEAFGRAARVLEKATDREITADAWLFRDDANQATGAYLESIGGTARRFSGLTIRGLWRGFVRRGHEVQIERLSNSGNYARVDAPRGHGYLLVNRLRIGRPLPAIQPTPQPFGGPGLTGSVTAATSGN